jgi:hypothetical protein
LIGYLHFFSLLPIRTNGSYVEFDTQSSRKLPKRRNLRNDLIHISPIILIGLNSWNTVVYLLGLNKVYSHKLQNSRLMLLRFNAPQTLISASSSISETQNFYQLLLLESPLASVYRRKIFKPAGKIRLTCGK